MQKKGVCLYCNSLYYITIYLTLLFLIVVSSIQTAEASTADVKLFLNGKQLTTISYYHQYSTTARVIIQTDMNVTTINSVKADFSELTEGSIHQVRNLLCIKNIEENKLNCTTANVKVYLKTKSNANINITISNTTNQENIVTTISFSVDNQKPVVTFVGTDSCEQRCYYKPGPTTLIAKIQDDNPLTQANIYIRTDNMGKVKTISCDDGNCKASKDMPSCNQGQAISIAVVSPSRDDAGNEVDYSQGNASNTIYCDNKKPIISSFNITSDYSVSQNIFAQGSTITIDVNGSDYSPVFIDANFSVIGGQFTTQECEKTGSNFECSISSTILTGAGTVKIPITIRDITGNEVKLDKNIEISTIVSETPRLWKISPNIIKIKVPANYLEYSSYLTYAYTSLSTPTNAEIINIEPGACIPDNESGTAPEMNIQKFKNKLLLGFDFDVGSVGEDQVYDYGINKYRCAIAVYSKLGNKVYEQPEIKNITLRVNFYYTTDPAKNLQKEIVNAESEINNFQKTGFGKLYSAIVDFYKLEPVCQISYGVKTAETVLNSVQFSLAVSSAVFPPLEGPAVMMEQTKETLRFGPGFALLNNPLVTTYCKILSCNLVNVSKVLEKTHLKNIMLADSAQRFGKWLGYTDINQMLDPYDNYASAALQLCPGAMAYHIARYKSIDCSYLLCLDMAKKTGITPEYCRTIKHTEQCRFWWGGLKAIPWVQLEHSFIQIAKEAALNPLAFGLGLVHYGACKFIRGARSNAACYVPVLLIELDKTWHLFKDIQHFNWYQGRGAIETGQQVCDEVANYIKQGENRRALDNYGFDSTKYFLTYNRVFYQHLISINDPDCGKVYLKPSGEGRFHGISGKCKDRVYVYEIHKNEITMEEAPTTLTMEGLKKQEGEKDYEDLQELLKRKREAILENLRAEGINDTSELEKALKDVDDAYQRIEYVESVYNGFCGGKSSTLGVPGVIPGGNMPCDQYEKEVIGDAQKEYHKAKVHVYSVMIKLLSEAYWNNPAALVNTFRFYRSALHGFMGKILINSFHAKLQPGKSFLELARYINRFDIDEVSRKVCSGGFKESTAISGGEVFKTPVAWISGVKSKIINITSSGQLEVLGYNYLITGKVVNNKDIPLDFEVYLKGDGRLLINDTTVKNSEYPVTGSLIFMGNDSRSYSFACINFKQANFYDILGVSPWVNKELCNKIVEVD